MTIARACFALARLAHGVAARRDRVFQVDRDHLAIALGNRPAARAVSQSQRAVLQIDQALDDGQAETRAVDASREERLEDALLDFRGNARPTIDDDDPAAVGGCLDMSRDVLSGRGLAGGP